MPGCALLGIQSDANNLELDSSWVQRVAAWMVTAIGFNLTCPRCKRWIKTQWDRMNHCLSLRKLLEERWKMALFGTSRKGFTYCTSSGWTNEGSSQKSIKPLRTALPRLAPAVSLTLTVSGLFTVQQKAVRCCQRKARSYSHHRIIEMAVSKSGLWGYYMSAHVCTWKDPRSQISQTLLPFVSCQSVPLPKQMLLCTGVPIPCLISGSAALGSKYINSNSPSRRRTI